MIVYYLSFDKLEKFREKITKHIEQYKDGKLKFVEANDLIRALSIKSEDFELDTSEGKPSDSDYKNIKIFYKALKNLKDSQATDERLWAGLCHYPPFWSYLQYRWPLNKKNSVEEQVKNIKRRYFFDDGIRSIIFNGLARLWWYGRMTYNEKAEDPFELTKYICGNLTERGFRSLTHNFNNNREILRIFLTTLMNFEKKHKLTVEEHENMKKRMDLWGGKILLDALSDEELTNKINDYLGKLIKNRKK